jgi:hypothetical protein
MSTNEMLVFWLIIVVFVGFAAVLAYESSR